MHSNISEKICEQIILKTRIDVTSYEDATQKIIDWVKRRESRYVCAANVHMVMEAFDSEEFCKVVNSADLVTPDGMPLVWFLRLMGISRAKRVYGPDLMLYSLAASEQKGISVGFYGGSEQTLSKLLIVLTNKYPGLKIVYAYSPPFRELTPEEEWLTVQEINAAKVDILYVGLGCPKQEYWMARSAGAIHGVMLGVGAAFDFISGGKPQAPRWMMSSGLEWLFRILSEPRRLWHRYLINNPRFMLLIASQIILRFFRKK